MATPTTTIDALPAAAGVTGTQLIVIQETGVTKRASVDELVDYANAHLVVDLTASQVAALTNPSVAGNTVQSQLTSIISKIDTLFAGGGGGGSPSGTWYRWEGTQEEYDVLPEYRDDTLYAIHDAPVGPPSTVACLVTPTSCTTSSWLPVTVAAAGRASIVVVGVAIVTSSQGLRGRGLRRGDRSSDRVQWIAAADR